MIRLPATSAAALRSLRHPAATAARRYCNQRRRTMTAAAAPATPSSSMATTTSAPTPSKDLGQLRNYLRRIGFAAGNADAPLPAATLDNLVAIHKAHVLHIPFENLIFIHPTMKGTSRPIDMDSLHRRIVDRRRGGMCQEMNKLLRHHLTQLGYDCYSGLAAVVLAASLPSAAPQGVVSSHNLGATQACEGTHQVIFTQVEGSWHLCDVGFGGMGLVEPLLLRAYDDVDTSGPTQQPPPPAWLAAQGESTQGGTRYRLRRGVLGSAELLSTADALTHPEKESFVGWYLQALVKDAWLDSYWFSLVPTTQAVLQACSDYTFRNHPLFTKQVVCTQPLDDGRRTLNDFTLKIRREGQPTETRVLQSQEERDAVLAGLFNIDLTAFP